MAIDRLPAQTSTSSIGPWMKAPQEPQVVEQPVLARQVLARTQPQAPAHQLQVPIAPIKPPRVCRAARRRIRAQLIPEMERALAEPRPNCSWLHRHESIA